MIKHECCEFVVGGCYVIISAAVYVYKLLPFIACSLVFLLGVAFLVGGVVDFIDERKSI